MFTLNRPLILASKSPRRQQLLRDAGFTFEVISADVDETYPPGTPATSVPSILAERKAAAFWDLSVGQLILTADTIVVLQGKILEKPTDRSEALEMLNRLSGAEHSVYTGVCLLADRRMLNFFEITHVQFRPLSQTEIEYYVDHYEPYDKAGGYGIQDWIGLRATERIQGDYYNVMGLPVCRLIRELAAWEGISTE